MCVNSVFTFNKIYGGTLYDTGKKKFPNYSRIIQNNFWVTYDKRKYLTKNYQRHNII